MSDMSLTIAPKSDQLNADDLLGGPRTITITRVTAEPSSSEQPVSVFFDGDNGKPYRPCKSMRRVMVAAWGPDSREYIGRRMTIYRDEGVTFGGMKVGGIRISHVSDIDRDMVLALTQTRSKRAPYQVKKLAAGPDTSKILARAEGEARKGRAAFLDFYNSDEGKAHRDAIKPHMEKFKELVTAAENDANEDPLGAQRLTPDEEAQILAGIEAENASHPLPHVARSDLIIERHKGPQK